MSTTASKEQQLSRERQELASQQAEVAALREENQKKHSQEKQKNIEALHKCLESFDSFETLSLSEFFLGVGEMLTWPANHPGLAIGAWQSSLSVKTWQRMAGEQAVDPPSKGWGWGQMGLDGARWVHFAQLVSPKCGSLRTWKTGLILVWSSPSNGLVILGWVVSCPLHSAGAAAFHTGRSLRPEEEPMLKTAERERERERWFVLVRGSSQHFWCPPIRYRGIPSTLDPTQCTGSRLSRLLSSQSSRRSAALRCCKWNNRFYLTRFHMVQPFNPTSLWLLGHVGAIFWGSRATVDSFRLEFWKRSQVSIPQSYEAAPSFKSPVSTCLVTRPSLVQIIAPTQEQLGTAIGQLHLFVPQHAGSQMVWPRATFGPAKGRSEGRAKDATGASGGPSSQLWCNELSYASYDFRTFRTFQTWGV